MYVLPCDKPFTRAPLVDLTLLETVTPEVLVQNLLLTVSKILWTLFVCSLLSVLDPPMTAVQ